VFKTYGTRLKLDNGLHARWRHKQQSIIVQFIVCGVQGPQRVCAAGPGRSSLATVLPGVEKVRPTNPRVERVSGLHGTTDCRAAALPPRTGCHCWSRAIMPPALPWSSGQPEPMVERLPTVSVPITCLPRSSPQTENLPHNADVQSAVCMHLNSWHAQQPTHITNAARDTPSPTNQQACDVWGGRKRASS
jgi:hypothetical protein